MISTYKLIFNSFALFQLCNNEQVKNLTNPQNDLLNYVTAFNMSLANRLYAPYALAELNV